MTIQEIIQNRDIKEILHFTTHLGLVGVLDSRAVKSRAKLKNDQRLEHILRLNTRKVMDSDWIDYVNLSISRINGNLFDISSLQWHLDVWWCILSFDPIILTHEGVYFVTTNNIYQQHLKRGRGSDALEVMFAPVVKSRYGTQVSRTLNTPAFFTTCSQAEVLYPGELSTEYLTRVYVRNEEDQDDVYGQIRGLCHQPIEVIVSQEKFNPV